MKGSAEGLISGFLKLQDRDLRRQRIRDLMVSLVARGLHVEEAEARFYLDDANMDVGLACRTLVEDRKWSSS